MMDPPGKDKEASAPPWTSGAWKLQHTEKRIQRCPRSARNGCAGLGRGTRLGGKRPGEPATPRIENTTSGSDVQYAVSGDRPAANT